MLIWRQKNFNNVIFTFTFVCSVAFLVGSFVRNLYYIQLNPTFGMILNTWKRSLLLDSYMGSCFRRFSFHRLSRFLEAEACSYLPLYSLLGTPLPFEEDQQISLYSQDYLAILLTSSVVEEGLKEVMVAVTSILNAAESLLVIFATILIVLGFGAKCLTRSWMDPTIDFVLSK